MRKSVLYVSGVALALGACSMGMDSPNVAAANVNTGNGHGNGGQNTPGFIKNAKDLGPTDPSAVINVTAWLKLHNEAQLDQLVSQQQTKGHANFHKWLKQSDFNAQFGPTANELNAVQNWLNAHNLTTVEVEPNNFYVKVQGSVADVQKAFHVQIDNYSLDGVTYRSNTSDPNMSDQALGHVAALGGLDDYGFAPLNVRPVGPDGETYKPVPLDASAAANPDGAFFERACFRAPETHTFSGPVTATYTGNRYGADITNTNLGHLAPCGYSPGDVRAIYNMKQDYAAGYDGTGETIVIVDAYGSPTIEYDAGFFSYFYGLPPIDLTVVKAQGLLDSKKGVDWAGETTLDVEWAHAMAPGAKIALVVAPNSSALDEAINLAVVRHLGNTVSNSWSSLEGFGNPAKLNRMERILEMAAAEGVDVNFSSGDSGDEAARVGFPDVDYPGSSPFATSIGGTSAAIGPQRQFLFETGWGNNRTRVATEGDVAQNPPLHQGFIFGAGGGESLTFAQPAFQLGKVPGGNRMVPDVGMLADPFTGVEIIQTDPSTGELGLGVIGGTSLACPLFSGVMAIAAQKAGHGLGQAAPLLYALNGAGLRDVGTPASDNDVVGSIGPTAYSAVALVGPETTTAFLSALYQSASTTRWYVLSFNTDSSLAAGPGWDNVTGVGAPDGLSFLKAIAP
jgi:subtilase family serine protease